MELFKCARTHDHAPKEDKDDDDGDEADLARADGAVAGGAAGGLRQWPEAGFARVQLQWFARPVDRVGRSARLCVWRPVLPGSRRSGAPEIVPVCRKGEFAARQFGRWSDAGGGISLLQMARESQRRGAGATRGSA